MLMFLSEKESRINIGYIAKNQIFTVQGIH